MCSAWKCFKLRKMFYVTSPESVHPSVVLCPSQPHHADGGVVTVTQAGQRCDSTQPLSVSL